MRFILTISLIIIAIIAYNNNNYNSVEIPQFSEEELQFICIEEGLL